MSRRRRPPRPSFPEFEAASRRTTFAPRSRPARARLGERQARLDPRRRAGPELPARAHRRSRGAPRRVRVPDPARTPSVLGVLEFFSREIRRPDEELLALLATVGSQIGQFIERKRAEEELRTLFETSRDMLCVAGFDGYFRRLNPAWERTLGFTTEELLARPLHRLRASRRPRGDDGRGGEVAAGASAVLFENRYRCKDGSYRWLSWNVDPAAGAKG